MGEDQEEKRDILVDFFTKNVHNKYNIYFWGFIMMETCNWVIVLIQFGLTNVFLHYKFSSYGVDVLNYYRLPEEEQREHRNPMCNTFPRIASCDYWRWGSGGKQENINAICILGLNHINDKIFLLLLWWCLFITWVAILRLLWRAAQTRSSWLRFHMINMRMNRYFKRSHKMDKIRAFIDDCKLGDWFVLYQMSKNLNRPFFMDFLTQLSVRYSIRRDEEDTDSDTGDNFMTMLLKPSYTAQESMKSEAEEKEQDTSIEIKSLIRAASAKQH